MAASMSSRARCSRETRAAIARATSPIFSVNATIWRTRRDVGTSGHLRSPRGGNPFLGQGDATDDLAHREASLCGGRPMTEHAPTFQDLLPCACERHDPQAETTDESPEGLEIGVLRPIVRLGRRCVVR